MTSPDFIERIEGGRLSASKQRLIDEYLRLMDGKYVAVSITKTNPKRSSQQNRRYFGLLVPIAQHEFERMQGVTFTKSETHAALKALFNKVSVANDKGEFLIDVPKSTRKLTTVGFNEYMDRVQDWLIEFCGVTIPEDGEQVKIFK